MAKKPFLFQHLWFPACLLVLLLLAIPGFILFFLHIFGGDSELNQWLEEEFQLSYHFPLHWSLALVLLLIPLLILLLYFLRLKRKPLQVPSTFLWRKSIEDLHVNSLFQWLRDNVLLLLQILTVLALIYAVMGFRFHGATSQGKHYILIVDNSASMTAKDVLPSRLEWAKQEALKVIDAAPEDSVGMVIAFNSKAVTLQGYTTDRAKLRDAVQAIEQTNCTTRIDDALSLADSLANQIRSTEDQSSQPEGPVDPGKERQYVQPRGIPTEVYLFSDGAFPELAESSLNKLNSLLAGNTSTLGNLQLHFQLAGVPGPENVNNVGILAFNVVRHGQDNPKNIDPNALKMQAFVHVRNYRPTDSEVKVVLDLETDGNVVPCGQETLFLPRRNVLRQKADAEKVNKDEPGDAQAIFDLPQLDLRSSTVLKVYLKDVNDDFALDDVAWLVVGMVRKAKVLIVTPGNVVLDAFFHQEAMKKVATVSTLEPAELTKDAYLNAARSGQYDLVIFDRCAPEKEEDMPAANTTFIDRPPPPWERGIKVLKNPYLVVSKKDHPLLRQITTLWDVGVSEAFRFHPTENLSPAGKTAYFDAEQKPIKPLPPLTRLLETTADQPMMITLTRGSFTDLVLTFPLIDDKGGLATNWPLQLSFPLFMRNLLYVLGNVVESDRERTVQPGEPMLLRPEADIKSLTITPPKGSPVKLDRGNRPEFIFAGTDQVGMYKVVRDDGQGRHFAVNLLDANESNIEPRTDIKIGSDEVAAGQERRQPREMWKWLALGALVLLLVEWYIYNRRIYV
jgi:hypothetical protein